MQLLIELAIIVTAGWVLWRLIAMMLRRPAPAEPRGEPFANVPVARKHGPKGRLGAVALAEPEGDEPSDGFPPRMI